MGALCCLDRRVRKGGVLLQGLGAARAESDKGEFCCKVRQAVKVSITFMILLTINIS